MEHSKTFAITSWILRLIVAMILLQTLFFKFSAAKESIYIFSTLGVEPWGRIGSRYRKMPTAAGAPPLGTGESAVWKQWARMTLPPDACRSRRPCARVSDWRRKATGRGSLRSDEIARIFTVSARLGSQHTLDANSPGRMDFGPFGVGKFECTLKVFGARILFPGFQISFTVNLCALIDGVR
jgi:hypothetical protein